MRVLFSRKLAFISKPRCGSTTIRLVLDKCKSEAHGDFGVNVGGKRPPYHPHMPAAYLQQVLRDEYPGHPPLAYFITIRHPVDMLWSYYRFFKPDENCAYTFSPKWNENNPMPFEKWIHEGFLAVAHTKWIPLAPAWISSTNLSPLSLESRAFDRSGKMNVDEVFRLEDTRLIEEWLSAKLDREIKLRVTNQSREGTRPKLGSGAVGRIRDMFPKESEIYNI